MSTVRDAILVRLALRGQCPHPQCVIERRERISTGLTVEHAKIEPQYQRHRQREFGLAHVVSVFASAHGDSGDRCCVVVAANGDNREPAAGSNSSTQDGRQESQLLPERGQGRPSPTR